MKHNKNMIGALDGSVGLKRIDSLIFMVGGVGYLVYPPLNFLAKLKVGDKAFLYTYTHVREDTLNLFGFETREELELFELLLSVSGIGPKTALTIVDRGVSSVRRAVMMADVGFFTSIPRLGTKNAQKVIIELKSKLGSISELDLSGEISGETQELIDALTQVGFTKSEVVLAIKKLPQETSNLEDKIRHALKFLGNKKL